MADTPDAPAGGSGDAQASARIQAVPHHELARLKRRLAREVVESNVLGGSLLAVSYFAFQVKSLPLTTRRAVEVFAAVILLGFAGVLLVSRHVTMPLVRWLAQPHDEPAPQRLQISVVVQPAVQSALNGFMWFCTAFGFGIAQTLEVEQNLLRRFLIAFCGTLLGGIATSAIIYLRVEHTWHNYLPRFFTENDPTTLPIRPGGALRSRLRLTYVFGTVIPCLMVALAVTLRSAANLDAKGLEQVVWFLALSGIVVTGILSTNIRRSITQPIERIEEAMDSVSRGDLDAHVAVDRVDEIGRLQSGFNEMVEGVRQREQLEASLRRQVGGQVADLAISEAASPVHLGGDVREVTAMFVDLASFSTMAESTPPADLAELLNAVFGVIVRAVEHHEGLVNKFQGDAVLAIFGAPRADPAHAVRALEAAEAVAGRLERMQLDFGIGISTGEVFAGNIGSEQRYEYTVVGDPVNEASRLQELTRQFERRVLLSGATAQSVRELGPSRVTAALVPVEPVVLRGKTEPTDVYSLSPQLWRGPQLDAGHGDDGDDRTRHPSAAHGS